MTGMAFAEMPAPELPAPERVNHPAHYNRSEATCSNCGNPIECIDVIEPLTCNPANAIKYVWRMDDKGHPIEDLEKAVWYLNREIQRRKKKAS